MKTERTMATRFLEAARPRKRQPEEKFTLIFRKFKEDWRIVYDHTK